MRPLLSASLIAATTLATPIAADPEHYVLDASHSQVLFSWSHLGFSTTFGMFSGFEGNLYFDAEVPQNSSITVSLPVNSVFTGWEQRDRLLLSDELFAATEDEVITFTSGLIEVTSVNTARIHGELVINGITSPVTLDAVLNSAGPSPFPQMNGAIVAGFDATTTLSRTDFGLGAYAPFVGDTVSIRISIEAIRAVDLED